MSDEAIIAQVSAILDGWTPTPNMGALAYRSGNAWLIGGVINGTPHIKHTGLAPNGPDTPDDPIEAAYWLVAHVASLRGPTSQPKESPAPSGVFNSEEPDGELTDGIAGHDSMVYEGSPLEADEPAYNDTSGDLGEAENVSYPDDPDSSDVADEPNPAQLGGVLIQGDALATAKNVARENLTRKQRSILDPFPWQDNLLEFHRLQSVRWAIAEGSHPPFTDEQQVEFDALSTFASWFGRVNQNAFNITVQIDDAETVEAVQEIDVYSGWPE